MTINDPVTLQTVLDRLAAAEALSARQRNDLTSAVRRAARTLGRLPAEIAANPRELRRRLDALPPAAVGLSPRRWANIRSLLRRALDRAGVRTVQGRATHPLAPEWEALRQAIPDKRHSWGLGRFLHWCCDRGMLPTDVDDAALTAFITELDACSFKSKISDIHRMTAQHWNRAADTIDGWPRLQLTVPVYRERYALPWSAFPPSLEADVERWLDRIRGKDLLSDYDGKPVTQSTADNRRELLLRFASALVLRGYDPARLETLSDLVDLDAVREGLRFYLERNDGEANTRIFDIACVLRAIAKHLVKVDKATLEAMNKMVKSIARKSGATRGITEKNLMRLQPFDDPAFCARLLRLPLDLMERVRRQDNGSRKMALLAQSATAIEILIMTAMRRGNLAGLDLERHVQWSTGRDRRVIRLFIPADEVKNRRRLDFPLTERSQRVIDTYRKLYRPRLAGTPTGWLFPGAAADHKGAGLLGAQISRTIRRELGVDVHPHLFRHLGVKFMEHRRPGSLEIMRRVLGHSSLDTLLKYYADLQMGPAVRVFDDAISGLGEQSDQRPHRPAWRAATSKARHNAGMGR